MLRRAHEPVPVRNDVLRRSTDLSDGNGHGLGGHHFHRVPGTNRQLVRVRLLARNVDAHFAAHAPLQINLAPLLSALYDTAIDLFQFDAIDGADLEARFAPGAIVGVDDRQLFRNFFAWSFF